MGADLNLRGADQTWIEIAVNELAHLPNRRGAAADRVDHLSLAREAMLDVFIDE